MHQKEAFLKYSYMPFKNFIPAVIISVLLLCSCKNAPEKHINLFADLKTDTSIHYAKRFSIASNDHVTAVYLFGNRANFDTTAVFLLCKDSVVYVKEAKNTFLLHAPCKKIAALSSIYASMLCDLGALNTLAAIDNMDYIINPQISAKFNAEHFPELAKGPKIDLEQTVKLRPDVIFTFGMGDPQKDVDPKLQQAGIPVAVSVDHLEASPLARAEWIKFFAAFAGKKSQADSVFSGVEKSYLTLKKMAGATPVKPTVFSEIKYGDAWYLPGGKSFMAQLMNDAGADYICKNDTSAGSLPLSFEQVYAKAKHADYWINLSMVNTKAELLSFESRYAEFNAFKKGNLYNNNKVTNAKGYSTYWETGMIYPNRILSDLIRIFHPELKGELDNAVYYYKQIK